MTRCVVATVLTAALAGQMGLIDGGLVRRSESAPSLAASASGINQPQGPSTVPAVPTLFAWEPRLEDVAAGSEAEQSLRFILQYARSVEHLVVAGESLDLILRRRYQVSAQYGRAYSLYMNEVRRRNTQRDVFLDNLRLKLGAVLLLPSGPRYSMLELPTGSDTDWKVAVARSGISLGRLDEAFGVLISPGARAATAEQMKDERLAPPPLPETNTSFGRLEFVEGLYSPTETPVVPALPTFIAALETASATCGSCTPMPEALGVTAPLTELGSRLLVADSGIVDPLSVDPPNRVVLDGEDYRALAELAPNHHGTFIYSQLSASLKGVLPKNRIDVANVGIVASDQNGVTGKLGLDVTRLGKVLKLWDNQLPQRNPGCATAVVNLSFAGGTAKRDFAPAWTRQGRLLIVVAAGNDGNNSNIRSLADMLFASENNVANSPLLVVGALDALGGIASYSNADPGLVDLFAQGSCVCGVSGQLNGTSHAAPIVAAAAAIVAADRPRYTPREVKWWLIATSDLQDTLAGMSIGGRVNLGRALRREIVVARDNLPELMVQRIELPSEAGLRALADAHPPRNRILRLHRIPCENGSAATCFSVMRAYASFDRTARTIVVSPNRTAKVFHGALEELVDVSTIRDIIVPLEAFVEAPAAFVVR